MILMLPVTFPWRVAGAVGWTLGNAIRLLAIYQGYRRCQRIRIDHTGHVVVVAPDGCCVQATLLSGSLVLANVAWLRIESATGRRYFEPLRGRARQSVQWRRLQVIWRHLGAAA